MSIPARFQVIAKSTDSSELLRGYLIVDSGEYFVYGNHGKLRVDEKTVEPIAAKPIRIENPTDGAICRCPNCNFGFAESTRNEYCPTCGQRVSWED